VIRPPFPHQATRPDVEARDDRGRAYTIGGAIDRADAVDRSNGFITLPLAPPQASWLRVRMRWSPDSSSPWQRPAHELRITL
jgi:hypothetical protein